MKKILTIVIITIICCFAGSFKIIADDKEDNNIKLSLDFYYLGKKPYWSYIGEGVIIGVDKNDFQNLRVLTLQKVNVDGSSEVIENPLNIDNINITSEYNDILSANICGQNVCLKGLSEGISNLVIKYTYNNKYYSIEVPWQVIPKEIPYFDLNHKVPVLLNVSNVNYI